MASGIELSDIYPGASKREPATQQASGGSENITGFPVVVWVAILVLLIIVRALYEAL